MLRLIPRLRAFSLQTNFALLTNAILLRHSPLLCRKQNYTFRIYTRTGDEGNTGLFTGERRPKANAIFDALGNVDEVSCCIGMGMAHLDVTSNQQKQQLSQRLERIQCMLQDLGAKLATPATTARETHLKKTQFCPSYVPTLESWIDEYQESLPPLKNFILPSGGKSAASLHLARAVCRRAERSIVYLHTLEKLDDPEILRFINRLSDFLFSASRWACHLDGGKENIYRKEASNE